MNYPGSHVLRYKALSLISCTYCPWAWEREREKGKRERDREREKERGGEREKERKNELASQMSLLLEFSLVEKLKVKIHI